MRGTREPAMIDAKAQPHSPAVIPVRVFGMDADGRPFVQLATARNLTLEHAILERVEHRLAPGAVIGIQYEEHKTRVRVLWVCELDGARDTQLGIQLIDARQCPWSCAMSAQETRSRGNFERRRFPRHQLSVGMEISDLASGHKVRVKSSDLSVGGCYIETMLPLALGTGLEIEMWIESSKVSARAIVRTCDPGVGMGIEFVGVTPDKQRQLEDLLASCSRRLASIP